MWNCFRRVTTIARANQYILGRPVLQGTFNSTMEMMMLDFKWSASTRHGTFTMGWLRAVVKCSLRLQQIYGPFDVRHMVRRTILRPRGERRSLEHDDIEDEVARVSSSARSVNIFFHVHHGHGNVFAAITPVSTASIIIGCRGVASLAVYTAKLLHAVAPVRATEETGDGGEQRSPPSLQVTRAPGNLP